MKNDICQEKITGSRNFSNFFWAFFLNLGGSAFLLTGISSYIKINLLPFTNGKNLVFLPQGATMLFYGTISLSLSIYIILTLYFNVGSGYNEYNCQESVVKIIRKGFPGKNREILLTYSRKNIRAIGIKITEGLNPIRNIYLCLKDNRKIPLNSMKELQCISDIERKAEKLAKFLDLKLESL